MVPNCPTALCFSRSGNLTTDSDFAQRDLPGRRQQRKRGFKREGNNWDVNGCEFDISEPETNPRLQCA
jgi:hypothetical protein